MLTCFAPRMLHNVFDFVAFVLSFFKCFDVTVGQLFFRCETVFVGWFVVVFMFIAFLLVKWIVRTMMMMMMMMLFFIMFILVFIAFFILCFSYIYFKQKHQTTTNQTIPILC